MLRCLPKENLIGLCCLSTCLKIVIVRQGRFSCFGKPSPLNTVPLFARLQAAVVLVLDGSYTKHLGVTNQAGQVCVFQNVSMCVKALQVPHALAT